MGGLLSNGASSVQLMSDGNLDALYTWLSCSFDAGYHCVLGSAFLRGRVRIYAPMRVAAQREWGRDLTLQIIFGG